MALLKGGVRMLLRSLDLGHSVNTAIQQIEKHISEVDPEVACFVFSCLLLLALASINIL